MADDKIATDAGPRYALALFELAKDGGQLDAVGSDLAALKGMLAESADLRRLLSQPTFTSDDKTAGLKALAVKAGFGDLTMKFLGLLGQNGRTALVPSVIRRFEQLVAVERDEIAAEVVTAIPLSAAQSKSLGSALRDALGKDPKIEARVDPSLLGGMRVRVGSRLFDSSLKSKLASLKFALKRA